MKNSNRQKRRIRRVYFLRAETLGFIKIGVTNSLPARFAQLRKTSPDPLTLLGSVECRN